MDAIFILTTLAYIVLGVGAVGLAIVFSVAFFRFLQALIVLYFAKSALDILSAFIGHLFIKPICKKKEKEKKKEEEESYHEEKN